MSAIRVYIKPFNSLGAYQADFTEVTDYVEKLGSITFDSDSGGYDIGVYRNSGCTLQLNNLEGKFADVTYSNSIFRYTRNNSIVKVTFDLANFPLVSTGGDPFDDEYVTNETTVFEGLLNDDSLVEDAKSASISFRVIGFERLFDQEKVAYNSLVAGDSIEDVLYTMLNVPHVTDLLTVSAGNISVGLDQVLDDLTTLEDKQIKTVLDELLLLGNAIMYIDNRTVYIKPRTVNPTLEFTFHGPQSDTGVENILALNKISNGHNKIFNFFSWNDSVQTAARNPSIRKYGRKPKELSSDLFTNTTKQFNVMEELLDEFKDPKREMEVTTNISYTTLALQILDKVNLNYPLQAIEAEGFDLPICGLAICGSAVLPKLIFSFSSYPETYFKVLKRTINLEKREITFKIREV